MAETLALAFAAGLIIGIALAWSLVNRKWHMLIRHKYTDDPKACLSVLPEYKITIEGLSEIPQDWAPYSWANIGRRTKLGGEPDWIQDVNIPVCAECKQAMVFVAQIDSVSIADKTVYPEIETRTGRKIIKFMYGDVGMIYVFMCPDCGSVDAFGQCT